MRIRQFQRLKTWFKSKAYRWQGAIEVAAGAGGDDGAKTSSTKSNVPSALQRVGQKLAKPSGRAVVRGLTFLFLLLAAWGLWQGTRINRLVYEPLVLPQTPGIEQLDASNDALGQVPDMSLVGMNESTFGPEIPSLTLPEVLYPEVTDRLLDAEDPVEPAVLVTPILPEILDLSQGIWPVVGAVQGDYGWHRDPSTNDWRFRAGLVIEPEREQAPVRASLPGVVQSVGTSGTGYRLVVAHAEGWTTEYVGLSSLDVNEGESVTAGDQIGDIAIAPHRQGLYFVMRDSSGPVNPADVLFTPSR